MTTENTDGPIIALDYDGTITTNVDHWIDFINMAEEAGYRVLIATMRYAHEKTTMDERVLRACPWVVTTGRKAKRQFLEQFGIIPAIWIDDQPNFILYDAAPPVTFKDDDSGLFGVLDFLYGDPLQRKHVVVYRTQEAHDVLVSEFHDPETISDNDHLFRANTFNHMPHSTLLIHERFFSRVVDVIQWDGVHLYSTSALKRIEYELAMKHVPSAISTGITLDPQAEGDKHD